MKMDKEKREALLNLGTISPPAALTELSRFDTPSSYSEFLAGTRIDPIGYWREVADDLPFEDNPVQICFAGAPDAPALVVLDPAGEIRSINRGQLYRMVCAAAVPIDGMKLKPGSTLAVSADSGACLLVGSLACLHRGMVPQPLVSGRRSHTGASGVLEINELPSEASPRPPQKLSPEAIGVIFEGLSGQKLSLPLGGFIRQAASSSRHLLDTGVKEQPLWIHCPERPTAVLAAAIGHLVQGRSLGFLYPIHTSTPKALASALSTVGAKSLLLGVSALAAMEGADFAANTSPDANEGISLILLEGTSARPSHAKTVRENLGAPGAHVVHLLAQPEAGGFIAGPNPLICPVRSGAVIHGAPGADLCIIDSHGKACPPGVGGYLSVRAPLPGMARELAIQEPPFLLETRAREDLNGVLWTMGEVAMRPAGADTVPIPQLEAFISELGYVEQVAVVRFSGVDIETTSRAFITPSPVLAPDKLIEKISAAILEKFGEKNVPNNFEIRDELPRSRSGKLLRTVLRRSCEDIPVARDDVVSAAKTLDRRSQ